MCVCVCRAVFPVLAVKLRTLAVRAFRLNCVWKGKMVPGHSDRTCQLPEASHARGCSVLHNI